MRNEAEFNRYAAGEFIIEYQRETGQMRRLKRIGSPFPDVILEAPDGREVGVEFVSVVLAFINQEHGYFDRYRRAFLTALEIQRPRYRRVKIKLQPHRDHVEHLRPMQLPDINSPEGRKLIADFGQLLNDRFEDLSTIWGGKDGGALLNQLCNIDGTLCYPILSKHFGAVMFHHMTPQEVSANTTPLDEQPVIENPVIWYRDTETVAAVLRALGTKTAKGPAYSSELLVVHTLEFDHPAWPTSIV